MVNTNGRENLNREVFETQKKLLELKWKGNFSGFPGTWLQMHILSNLGHSRIFFSCTYPLNVDISSFFSDEIWGLAINLYYQKGSERRPNLSAYVSANFQDKQSTKVRREHWEHDRLSKCHSRKGMTLELEGRPLRNLIRLFHILMFEGLVLSYITHPHTQNSIYMVSLVCLWVTTI